ncbi:hypothetical protein CHS0354_010184 [Potamilus streckersoni]|uniref:Uncharacterized protein n=1 Tax=Potamilus streckersoni TaxID=2493646 RepID=A0AAE0VHU3_9BIVA|nr:hypothetical protein CHS0354_010184 [Potamilus streckersoni]
MQSRSSIYCFTKTSEKRHLFEEKAPSRSNCQLHLQPQLPVCKEENTRTYTKTTTEDSSTTTEKDLTKNS